MAAKIVVPVRMAAWLNGDLGRTLEKRLADLLPGAKVSRLPRSLLVESDTATPGALLEAVAVATAKMDTWASGTYPVFHHEMGPIWTGTLQSIHATSSQKGDLSQ